MAPSTFAGSRSSPGGKYEDVDVSVSPLPPHYSVYTAQTPPHEVPPHEVPQYAVYTPQTTPPREQPQYSVYTPQSTPPRQQGPPPRQHESALARISTGIRDWTPTLLLLSYFVCSIALYTVLNDEATKIFWFLYLTIATVVAGTTALEAYDGLTPLREARKAVAKGEKNNQGFKTSDEALPTLELVFDYVDVQEPQDLESLKRIRNGLLYPSHKVRLSVLCREHSTAHAMACDYDESLEMAGVRIQALPQYATFSIAGKMAAFLAGTQLETSAIIGIFSAGERPHPHAVRHAAEKLTQDAKVDVIQGRSITVPQSQRSFFAGIANLEHDMVYALLRPGRSITWGLNAANNSGAYWKSEVLRTAVSATATFRRDGMDLGYMATHQGARTLNDLRITSYEPCPNTFRSYLQSRAKLARGGFLAALRYSKFAFTKHTTLDGQKNKWSLKKRFAILYTLPILQLASHAIVQYLCMALAILFTQTPTSTLDFAYTIYFPYPISEWFIIGGLVCLASTVFMIYMARSEFVPLWTAPVVLLLYPPFLVFRALVDIYAQFEVAVQ